MLISHLTIMQNARNSSATPKETNNAFLSTSTSDFCTSAYWYDLDNAARAAFSCKVNWHQKTTIKRRSTQQNTTKSSFNRNPVPHTLSSNPETVSPKDNTPPFQPQPTPQHYSVRSNLPSTTALSPPLSSKRSSSDSTFNNLPPPLRFGFSPKSNF